MLIFGKNFLNILLYQAEDSDLLNNRKTKKSTYCK